jgi:hypothetical protein
MAVRHPMGCSGEPIQRRTMEGFGHGMALDGMRDTQPAPD